MEYIIKIEHSEIEFELDFILAGENPVSALVYVCVFEHDIESSDTVN
jgi:hypothetical protein